MDVWSYNHFQLHCSIPKLFWLGNDLMFHIQERCIRTSDAICRVSFVSTNNNNKKPSVYVRPFLNWKSESGRDSEWKWSQVEFSYMWKYQKLWSLCSLLLLHNFCRCYTESYRPFSILDLLDPTQDQVLMRYNSYLEIQFDYRIFSSTHTFKKITGVTTTEKKTSLLLTYLGCLSLKKCSLTSPTDYFTL